MKSLKAGIRLILALLSFILFSCHKEIGGDYKEIEDDTVLYGLTPDNTSVTVPPENEFIWNFIDDYNWSYLDSVAGKYEGYMDGKLVEKNDLRALDLGGAGHDFYIGEYGLYVTARDGWHCPGGALLLQISSSEFEMVGSAKIFKNFNSLIYRDVTDFENGIIPASASGVLNVTSQKRFWEVNGELRFDLCALEYRDRDKPHTWHGIKFLNTQCKSVADSLNTDVQNKHDITYVFKFNKMKYYKILPRDMYLINSEDPFLSLFKELPAVMKVTQKAREALNGKGYLDNKKMENLLKKQGKIKWGMKFGDDRALLEKIPKYGKKCDCE